MSNGWRDVYRENARVVYREDRRGKRSIAPMPAACEVGGNRGRNLQLQKIEGFPSPPTSPPRQRGATSQARRIWSRPFLFVEIGLVHCKSQSPRYIGLSLRTPDVRSGDYCGWSLLVLSLSGQLEASRGCHRRRLIGPRSTTLNHLTTTRAASTELGLPSCNEPCVHAKSRPVDPRVFLAFKLCDVGPRLKLVGSSLGESLQRLNAVPAR